MKTGAIVAALCIMMVVAAKAGPINQACAKSNRTANSQLCDCIQRVANMTLNGSDQYLAAQFFADPARAQEVRQSQRSSHRAFWDRYTTFGAAAESVCAQ